MINKYGPSPPLPPEFVEILKVMFKEHLVKYTSIGPPCSVVSVTLNKLNILKSNHEPGIEALVALSGKWEVGVNVGSGRGIQPDYIINADVESRGPLPIKINLNYHKSIRTERIVWSHHTAASIPHSEPIPFTIETFGSIGERFFNEPLPIANRVHGNNNEWYFGKNSLVATSDKYIYELIYSIECASHIPSEIPLSKLISIIHKTPADIKNPFGVIRQMAGYLNSHGFDLVNSYEHNGELILILDGPKVFEEFLTAFEQKK